MHLLSAAAISQAAVRDQILISAGYRVHAHQDTISQNKKPISSGKAVLYMSLWFALTVEKHFLGIQELEEKANANFIIKSCYRNF